MFGATCVRILDGRPAILTGFSWFFSVLPSVCSVFLQKFNLRSTLRRRFLKQYLVATKIMQENRVIILSLCQVSKFSSYRCRVSARTDSLWLGQLKTCLSIAMPLTYLRRRWIEVGPRALLTLGLEEIVPGGDPQKASTVHVILGYHDLYSGLD